MDLFFCWGSPSPTSFRQKMFAAQIFLAEVLADPFPAEKCSRQKFRPNFFSPRIFRPNSPTKNLPTEIFVGLCIIFWCSVASTGLNIFPDDSLGTLWWFGEGSCKLNALCFDAAYQPSRWSSSQANFWRKFLQPTFFKLKKFWWKFFLVMITC